VTPAEAATVPFNGRDEDGRSSVCYKLVREIHLHAITSRTSCARPISHWAFRLHDSMRRSGEKPAFGERNPRRLPFDSPRASNILALRASKRKDPQFARECGGSNRLEKGPSAPIYQGGCISRSALPPGTPWLWLGSALCFNIQISQLR
jgi:hypothetical protein